MGQELLSVQLQVESSSDYGQSGYSGMGMAQSNDG